MIFILRVFQISQVALHMVLRKLKLWLTLLKLKMNGLKLH